MTVNTLNSADKDSTNQTQKQTQDEPRKLSGLMQAGSSIMSTSF